MDERDRTGIEPDRVEPERHIERETTVIHTGERRGGGGLIAAIVLLLVVLVLAFLFFSGSFDRAADEVGVNVNVEAPDVEIPEVDIPEVDIDVAPSEGGDGNSN